MFQILKRSTCALFLALFGCSDTSTVHIDLTGLNYTDQYVSAFLVDGYGGANIYPNSGGGGFVCCVEIPRKWRPGMSVTVRWTDDSRISSRWKEKKVLVPQFQKADIGHMAVHFYPDGEVRVLVTMLAAKHPRYPYPRPFGT